MSSTVRRASVVAALGTLSLAVPLFGPLVAGGLAALVAVAGFTVRSGRVFDVLALPADREDGRLNSLLAFVLAVVVLGSLVGATSLPWSIVIGVVVLVGYGDLSEAVAGLYTTDRAVTAAAFCVGGGVAASVGQLLTHALNGGSIPTLAPTAVFLGASGALAAAILRARLPRYDDPLVVVVTGGLCWLLWRLDPSISAPELALALGVMIVLGYLSYALDTASVAGMLAGILLGLLTIVLGGWSWFVVLISFFGIGGLSTKFRYQEKRARGVAEGNDGARGSANVFSNSAIALVAVLGYAASDAGLLAVDSLLFQYAFAGAVATALGDTLSSEIGGVFPSPRLITTLEPVAPGTDGAVTWQGQVAGIAGITIVGAISLWLAAPIGPLGFGVIVAAGTVGILADSLFGATLEGNTLDNGSVNFCATLTGAVVAALLLAPLGIV
ncbi:putative membrane protein [Halovivax ruber XH-70]|uniref:Putative membrane protein n=1 Tax=Halovivax ruber (strain DSM 18193 / JCM 13892 / XH-70) TaxID=797302 RepID=L0IDF1_HALRX|nr:DUF92 domain-containing protein [Halovivax ruber]AGB16779.1 putative membrane protein [Halovivax ruber XH-70]